MKILFRFFSLLLVLSLLSSSIAFANNIEIDSDFEKNVEQKLEMALNNNQEPVDIMFLENDNGAKYKLNVYALDTSDLTRSTTNEKSITYIASTDNMQLVSPQTRGSIEDDIWDSSSSVNFSMTIYFKTNSDYPPGYLLTKIAGNASIVSGQSVTIKNQKISYGCESASELIKQHSSKSISSTNFSFNTGFSKYVHDSAGAALGANWSGTIQRGSSWNFSFPNYKFV